MPHVRNAVRNCHGHDAVAGEEEIDEVQSIPAEGRALFTPAEQEVTSRILRAWRTQSIADDLSCKEGTVKVHVKHVFDKLGVGSRADVIVQAALRWVARMRQ